MNVATQINETRTDGFRDEAPEHFLTVGPDTHLEPSPEHQSDIRDRLHQENSLLRNELSRLKRVVMRQARLLRNHAIREQELRTTLMRQSW